MVKRFIVGIALLVIFSSGVFAATDDSAGADLLQSHVKSGKLRELVKKHVEERGQAEILLVLDDTDVQEMAKKMRDSLHLTHNSKDILSENARNYLEKKNKILSTITPQAVLHNYKHFPVMHLIVNKNDLETLLKSKEVSLVSENGYFIPSLTESLPLIDAPLAHNTGATGRGTSVAVLDSGVDYTRNAFGNCTAPGQPAATCKVIAAQDFAPDDGLLDGDFNHHGTNVAAIVLGVAPDAKIVSYDVISSDGQAHWADVYNAADAIVNHRDDFNIVAVNMSFGDGVRYTSPCGAHPFTSYITNLRTAGITPVAGSGNNAFINGLAAPACIPGAVSVGNVYDSNIGGINWYVQFPAIPLCTDSTTAADMIACSSNSASFLTLLAPGCRITAGGESICGTSQSAPHVSGAVAVLKGQNPAFDVDDVQTRLTTGGVPVTDIRNNITTPRLNLFNTLTTFNLLPPVANFTKSNTPGAAPLNVVFTDTSTRGPTSWLWTFGDGYTSTQQNPAHTYKNPGSYTVTLISSNAYGSSSLSKANFIVVPTCSNQPVKLVSSSTFYPTIWDAYKAAGSVDTIQCQAIDFPEYLNLTSNKTVTLAGGYNCEYSNNLSNSTINGSLTITGGTVYIQDMVVQ